MLRAKDPFSPELTEAAYDGDLAGVKKLLASGVNIESTGGSFTALNSAVSNGKTGVARYLIDHGANLEAEAGSRTSLAVAISFGHFETARMLVARGARLDGPGDYRNSPLYCAIKGKRTDIAKWLLRQGANPNLQDWRGDTPLMDALDNPDLVRCLIRMGAAVNHRQDQGQTALSFAIAEKNPESVRILLAHGARQHRCRWDQSAVMVAVEDGTPEILRLLLQYHPWLEARTDGPDRITPGQTALEMALDIGNHTAARILRQHGAHKVSSPNSR
jgi:ankyrin repeat protein